MTWSKRATALAAAITDEHSRWRTPVATIPRHSFVPAWWAHGDDGWEWRNGPSDSEAWHAAAYADRSLVTRVGALHADHVRSQDAAPVGRPTPSATHPSLVVRMFQHACIGDDDRLLDVGTGSGYGAALAARRLCGHQVTSVDIDPYLVESGRESCASAGVAPTVDLVDATGELPYENGSFDRIVATVAARTVPESWLRVLRVGGRLVTTIAGTSLLVTAMKQEDGSATGHVEWDRAGFMNARHGDDYPPGAEELLTRAANREDGELTYGPYPVIDVEQAWDLASMLDILAPGIEHRYLSDGERHTALMAHADGSWARAEAVGHDRPVVLQGGPRRLWDELDACRAYWLTHGELPVRGASVIVTPGGRTLLARGRWKAELV